MTDSTEKIVVRKPLPRMAAEITIADEQIMLIAPFDTRFFQQTKGGKLRLSIPVEVADINLPLGNGKELKDYPISGGISFTLPGLESYVADIIADEKTNRLNIDRERKGKNAKKTKAQSRRERRRKTIIAGNTKLAEQLAAIGDFLGNFDLEEAKTEQLMQGTARGEIKKAEKKVTTYELIKADSDDLTKDQAETALSLMIAARITIERTMSDSPVFEQMYEAAQTNVRIVEEYIKRHFKENVGVGLQTPAQPATPAAEDTTEQTEVAPVEVAA